jgi:hypothetical protein
LDRISDEEARGIAEEGFKATDAYAAKIANEHASYKKGWAPFESMGLRDQSPETVQWAMQLAQAAQADPRAFYEWVNGDYANQFGLNQQQADEYGGGYEDPNAQLMQRMDALEQMFSGVDSRFEQQAQAQAQQEALTMIEGQIAKIEKEAGDNFDRAALEMVLPHFTEQAQSREELESAVPRAWEALQGLLNKQEQRTFNGKLNSPNAPEGSGMPDVTPPQAHTLKEAHKMAMDMAHRAGGLGR